MTSNLDELPGLLIELRELIRQAHAAIKDGNQLLKELRAISAEGQSGPVPPRSGPPSRRCNASRRTSRPRWTGTPVT